MCLSNLESYDYTFHNFVKNRQLLFIFNQVRPLVGQEKVHHEEQCISFVDGIPQLILGRNRGFKFDHVFRPEDKQVTMFVLMYSTFLVHINIYFSVKEFLSNFFTS